MVLYPQVALDLNIFGLLDQLVDEESAKRIFVLAVEELIHWSAP
jgi:hypothetical protein